MAAKPIKSLELHYTMSQLLIMDDRLREAPYRSFSLTWPATMQIYWDKNKFVHKKRVQLPQDWFGTPTWPSFHCFGTPIWLP